MQVVAGTDPVVESPFSSDFSGDFAGTEERRGLKKREPAFARFCFQRKVDPLLRVDVKNQIVGELGGESQGGTLGGQDEIRLLRAEDLFWIDRMQRRGMRRSHGRQGNDNNRLWIAERWRNA